MNAMIKQFLFISSIYLLAPTVDALSLNDPLPSETQEVASETEISTDASQEKDD